MISPKSVTEPSRKLDFAGKVFDLSNGTLENRPGMLRGLVRLWLLLVLGLLNRKGMERLLGRLKLALRPSLFWLGHTVGSMQGVVGSRVLCYVHC